MRETGDPARSPVSRIRLLAFSDSFLPLFDETHEILQLLDGMFGVTFVALVALRGKLVEPGADIFVRDIVPFSVGLQAQVDLHLRVVLLAARRELDGLANSRSCFSGG